MSRFVTKGFEVLEDDGAITKSYFIRDRESGLEILAEKKSNGKFTAKIGAEEFSGTIKSIKESFASAIDSGSGLDLEQPEEDVGESAGRGLWDCCHPAALLIELLAVSEPMLTGKDGQRLTRIIKHSLDNWGWADEKGEPDYDAARREMDLWMSIAPDNQGESHD